MTTIIWDPARTAAIVAIDGQSRRLADGRIEATYSDARELAECLELARFCVALPATTPA